VSVALVIQHTKRTRPVILSFCGLSGYKYFPTGLINGTIKEKKKAIEHKMCVLTSSTILSEMFLIPRIIDRDMIKNYIGLYIN
jgi:hypothetical protein